MIEYTLKKIGYATLTLFGVVSVIFMLFNMLPDDPAKMMLGQNQNKSKSLQYKKSTALINLYLPNICYTSMIFLLYHIIAIRPQVTPF